MIPQEIQQEVNGLIAQSPKAVPLSLIRKIIAWTDDISNSASGITLQTDGTPNGSQVLLNLIAGTNITLTDDGFGGVTIDAAGGGGGGITYGGAVTAGHNNEVLFIDGSGNLASAANFTYIPTSAFAVVVDDGASNVGSISINPSSVLIQGTDALGAGGALNIANNIASIDWSSGTGAHAGITAGSSVLSLVNNDGTTTTSWFWPTADAAGSLISDGAGNLSFGSAPISLTATQIAYGDGSNLMTSTAGLTYSPTTAFLAEITDGGTTFDSRINLTTANATLLFNDITNSRTSSLALDSSSASLGWADATNNLQGGITVTGGSASLSFQDTTGTPRLANVGLTNTYSLLTFSNQTSFIDTGFLANDRIATMGITNATGNQTKWVVSDLLNTATLSDSVSAGAGIYFAGLVSVGLTGAEVGLAIDALNGIYALGDPTTYGTINISTTGGSIYSSEDTLNIKSHIGNIALNTGTLAFEINESTLKYEFTGSNILKIASKDIDFTAVNAAGVWVNDNGAGLIAYKQDTGWAASTVTTPVKGGLTDLSVLSDVLSWAKAMENAIFNIKAIAV